MTILAATCLPQVPPEQLREVARAADQAGLAELWLWEDCFWGGAMTLASALLAWTDRMAVGIGVLPVPLRNVALTAMEAAALERLFPGRVTLGVGHGVQDWMGQVGARPGSPLTLLAEYLQALRGLLGGERVTTSADGTILTSGSTTPERLRAAREIIAGSRAAAGLTGPHQVVVYLLTVTGPDAARRLAAAGPAGTAAVAGDAAEVAAAVRFWAGAGADKVVLHPDEADRDPVGFVRFAAEQVQPLLG
jgi:alkanesulfonate monooxygenase SsuD/methylene tetrahydromethanopterin reductase-like flavin-dependent oxidoreductase (luciferase family)